MLFFLALRSARPAGREPREGKRRREWGGGEGLKAVRADPLGYSYNDRGALRREVDNKKEEGSDAHTYTIHTRHRNTSAL